MAVIALESHSSGAAFPRPTIGNDDRVPQELEVFQGYLDPAPDGMDVRYVWTLPGGHGENVRIADIELNWNLQHNDLLEVSNRTFLLVKGIDPNPEINLQHGTAVLGELAAADDGIGVTGIAHAAQIGLVNPVGAGVSLKVADAIKQAMRKLAAGDVVLIEMQSPNGPHFDPRTGLGLAPIEIEQDVFDAIQEATSRGITVVEPAGNGFENLDDAAFGGKFNRNNRDSGAIMVGAGLPPEGIYGPGPDRVRTEESNYGSRVDVQGWGRFVTTCGYGDLRHEQGVNNWYTTLFGGTSGAAAMVAGAAAIIQSVVKQRGREPLTAVQLRRLLASTGTPQAGNTNQSIGPRPNLRAAIEMLDTDPSELAPRITAIKYKKTAGKFVIDGENFVLNESILEIDGQPVMRIKFPVDYRLPGGVALRMKTKDNVSALVPTGVEVSLTILNPTTGKRSEPFPFTRP